MCTYKSYKMLTNINFQKFYCKKVKTNLENHAKQCINN